MALVQLKKAQALSREAANRLSIRFSESPALLVREGTDVSGNPTINVDDGTPAAGEQSMFVRIIPMPTLGTDAVGGAQQSFGPHIAQVVMEATVADAALAIVKDVHRLRLFGVLLKMGTRVEVYVRANGGAPVVGDITGTPTAVFTDLYWQMNGDM
jgi:hypothetical protein